MKKRFSILLSVLLSISLLFPLTSCVGSKTAPDVSFETLEDGTIRAEDGSVYSPLEDGTLSFSFRGEAVDIVVPAEFDGKAVTEISLLAFRLSAKTLRSVTLPNTIRKIGSHAFSECELLSKIHLPESVQTIEDGAFSGCVLLSEINLPKSVASIGDVAFAYCTSLKHITIPSGLIGSAAFSSSGLETITLSEGVEKISSAAFSDTNLKEVVFPSSLREIGQDAFAGCTSLTKVILNDGLQRVEVRAFRETGIKEIVIPASVSYLVEHAFLSCEALKDIYFEGNAPEERIYINLDGSADLSYTVHYHEGAQGFTSPEWCGHPTEIW